MINSIVKHVEPSLTGNKFPETYHETYIVHV